MKKVLISQDLSCYGQVSSEVALPILASSGYQTSLLPTALLSTHTGGFGENTYLDLSNEMGKILHHWQKSKINFDALYLGYLGGKAVDFWVNNISSFSNVEFCLIDPVMGDNGKLYHGMDEEYVTKMRHLAKYATILTPNLTEAMYLLGEKITPEQFSLNNAKIAAKELAQKLNLKNVIITGIPLNDQIGIVGYEKGELWQLKQEKLSGSYFGTGDMFASSFLAGILAKKTLKKSAQIAATFVKLAIKNTPSSQDRRLGPNYMAGLDYLRKEVGMKIEN